MHIENGRGVDPFYQELMRFLGQAFPSAKTPSALYIEIANRTEMSVDNVRKICEARALPQGRTLQKILAIGKGPELTGLADRILKLYHDLKRRR